MSWRQRNIDCPAQGGLRAAAFFQKTRARIKRATVLVKEIKSVWGSFQKMSWLPSPWWTSVSHNRNAQRPAIGMRVIVADKLDHYRFVVDIAKAPVAVNHAHCMVARRPGKEKRPCLPFFSMTSLAAAMALPAAARCDSCGHCGSSGQAEMRPLNLFVAGKTGLYSLMPRISRKSFLVKLVPGIEKAFLAFGMGWGDGPVKGGKKPRPDCSEAINGSIIGFFQVFVHINSITGIGGHFAKMAQRHGE